MKSREGGNEKHGRSGKDEQGAGLVEKMSARTRFLVQISHDQ